MGTVIHVSLSLAIELTSSLASGSCCLKDHLYHFGGAVRWGPCLLASVCSDPESWVLSLAGGDRRAPQRLVLWCFIPGTRVSRGHQQWLRDEGTGNSLQASLLPDPQPTRSGCIGLSRLAAPLLSQVSGALPQFPSPRCSKSLLGRQL